MATSQPSIVVKKSFTYRGSTKVWSNRYYLNNVPPDNAHWTTLSDAIVTAEKAILWSTHTIVGTVGYLAGSGLPVFTKTYSTAGTGSFAASVPATGDVAALVRYTTTARTSKNHPVYLFNYYHSAAQANSGAPDTLPASYATALGTYANAWVSGFSDGTTTYKKTGPHGAVAQGYVVEANLTHRDFPR